MNSWNGVDWSPANMPAFGPGSAGETLQAAYDGSPTPAVVQLLDGKNLEVRGHNGLTLLKLVPLGDSLFQGQNGGRTIIDSKGNGTLVDCSGGNNTTIDNTGGANVIIKATGGGSIRVGAVGTLFGIFAKAAAPTAAAQPSPTLVNNIAAGGVADTLANYADLVTYANDAAAIRNDLYQLGQKVLQVQAALKAFGWLT